MFLELAAHGNVQTCRWQRYMESKEYYEINQNTFSEEAIAEMDYTERMANNSEE